MSKKEGQWDKNREGVWGERGHLGQLWADVFGCPGWWFAGGWDTVGLGIGPDARCAQALRVGGSRCHIWAASSAAQLGAGAGTWLPKPRPQGQCEERDSEAGFTPGMTGILLQFFILKMWKVMSTLTVGRSLEGPRESVVCFSFCISSKVFFPSVCKGQRCTHNGDCPAERAEVTWWFWAVPSCRVCREPCEHCAGCWGVQQTCWGDTPTPACPWTRKTSSGTWVGAAGQTDSTGCSWDAGIPLGLRTLPPTWTAPRPAARPFPTAP